MTQQTVNEWYANKLGKTVAEFDDYDNHIAKVVFQFWSEHNHVDDLLEVRKEEKSKHHISDEDWKSLKVGDRVILNHRNTVVKVTQINDKSIFIDKKLFSYPFYFQYEVKEKVK